MTSKTRRNERTYRNKEIANKEMFEQDREKKTKESRKLSLKILQIEIKRSSNNYVIFTQIYRIFFYLLYK